MDFSRIFKYALIHLCIIAVTILFYGFLNAISDFSFSNLDRVIIVISTIPLSFPCYIYFALKCSKKPYLSSIAVLVTVLIVLQLSYVTFNGKFFVGPVILLPGFLQMIFIVGATYLGRKQGFIKYGL